MRNPLRKRLPKELISEFGKYLVIFLFMAGTIGLISGFLVADNSMISAYNDSFEKYTIEDGNFELESKASDSVIQKLEQDDKTIYNNFYIEENTKANGKKSVLRIFKDRKEINKACVMKGKLPEKETETAIDRMYADNNKIQIGDTITTGGRKLTVSGLIALPDYSALFSDNGDMMFDAVKFGVTVMSEDGFTSFESESPKIHYNYSWLYRTRPKDDEKAKEKSDAFLKVLSSQVVLKNYTPQYENQAIHFTGDDMGSDKSMMTTLLYILIAIMAFVFAITTSNTITKEASVIGTLRASGYTKGELIRHYMSMPLIITLIASTVGNILGYTVFKNVMASMYYGSYSLPTYHTLWNGEAFLMTTLVPLVIMMVINLLILTRKMSLSPLQFIRRDLTRKQKKKAVHLPQFRFFARFRIRVIFQNIPGYLMLFIGIVFANILLLFGMMMTPLLSHYQDEITTHMISRYQYILKAPMETKNTDAEKYSISSLETDSRKYNPETVSIYGISEKSKFVDADFSKDGVYVSDGLAEKYHLKKGGKVTLKEQYGDKKHTFKIAGIYKYPAALTVFMSQKDFWNTFKKENGFYNGYFTNQKIKDIDDAYIASRIMKDDLTKVSRQLTVSMGKMFLLVNGFSMILFLLLIYLLSKLIIEKNAAAISMVKILGYENREISRLYLMSTTLVVIMSVLISLPVSTAVMYGIYGQIMKEFTGWLTLYIHPAIYVKMFFLGLICYVLAALFQYRRIQKIPMEEALKNGE